MALSPSWFIQVAGRLVSGAGGGDTETGVLLNSLGGTTSTTTSIETRIIMRPGALLPGRTLLMTVIAEWTAI